MKTVAIVIALVLGIAGIMGSALAQPAAPARPPARAAQPAAQPAPAPAPANRAAHSPYGPNTHDIVEGHGQGMALLFWAFAAASIIGALFVISRRNLIVAVMGMVGSFLGIAAIYMMLYAQFLAILQMLVYAGAIMVLFVFVIMILNRPEDEPVAPTGHVGQIVGGIAILYLIGRLVMLLTSVELPDKAIALAAPAKTALGHDWGSVNAVGTDLFTGGLFPFEAISILLLIAVVGAIAIARPVDESAHGDEGTTGPGQT